jgi:penicillin-binding protein 1A
MTGGSLPAMTWRQIMTYAHQGIEIKPIPGVAPGHIPPGPRVAASESDSADGPAPGRPAALSQRAIEILQRVERRMDDAVRAVAPPASGPAASAPPAGAPTAQAAATPPGQ